MKGQWFAYSHCRGSILLTGRQAKGFMAALEKAMQKAGLAEGD